MDKNIDLNYKSTICFVALNARNILSGQRDLNHTGGAEVQRMQIVDKSAFPE